MKYKAKDLSLGMRVKLSELSTVINMHVILTSPKFVERNDIEGDIAFLGEELNDESNNIVKNEPTAHHYIADIDKEIEIYNEMIDLGYSIWCKPFDCDIDEEYEKKAEQAIQYLYDDEEIPEDIKEYLLARKPAENPDVDMRFIPTLRKDCKMTELDMYVYKKLERFGYDMNHFDETRSAEYLWYISRAMGYLYQRKELPDDIREYLLSHKRRESNDSNKKGIS